MAGGLDAGADNGGAALGSAPRAAARRGKGTGRHLGVLRVVTDYKPDNYFAKWENVDTRFLDFLNVKYLVTSQGVTMNDTRAFAMTALSRRMKVIGLA